MVKKNCDELPPLIKQGLELKEKKDSWITSQSSIYYKNNMKIFWKNKNTFPVHISFLGEKTTIY